MHSWKMIVLQTKGYMLCGEPKPASGSEADYCAQNQTGSDRKVKKSGERLPR
jgi:hypothetical protein